MCATFMTKTSLQTMKHVGKKMILGWAHQLKSTNCCSLCMSGRSCQNSNGTIALPFPLLSTNNSLLSTSNGLPSRSNGLPSRSNGLLSRSNDLLSTSNGNGSFTF